MMVNPKLDAIFVLIEKIKQIGGFLIIVRTDAQQIKIGIVYSLLNGEIAEQIFVGVVSVGGLINRVYYQM